jgi:hypothetical protein
MSDQEDAPMATVRRIMDRFWRLVDAESVVLFQYIFGTIFMLAGVYGIFIANAEPPLTLRGSMGHMDVRIWYWLNVTGPGCSLIGKCMRGRLTYAGMWMQLTGDAVISLALLAYISGTVEVESWGHGAYGAFLGAALCLCAGVTVTRDVRRLLGVEQRLR